MAATYCRAHSSSSSTISNPYSSSKSPFKFRNFKPSSSSSYHSIRFSVSCTLARDAAVKREGKEDSDPALWQRPDSYGRFGKFGGKYVPETLIHALSELESAFNSLKDDPDFQVKILLLCIWGFVKVYLLFNSVNCLGNPSDFCFICAISTFYFPQKAVSV